MEGRFPNVEAFGVKEASRKQRVRRPRSGPSCVAQDSNKTRKTVVEAKGDL